MVRPTPVVPGPLRPGARVAVVAPGSAVRRDAVEEGMAVLREWGYEPVPGPNLFAAQADLAGPEEERAFDPQHVTTRGDLAGSDEERAADLAWAFGDPAIDAIWAARGGWGAPRLLPLLDFAGLRERPRWLIGFSDLTALHGRLFDQGVTTLYGPHVAELPDTRRYDAEDLRRALLDPLHLRTIPGTTALVGGRARGRLAGGCLTLLTALAGTPWRPDLRGAVVFLEEVAEAPYRIDRMFWQARAAGLLDGITGLALGQFYRCEPPPNRPSRTVDEVLGEAAQVLGVPALAGLPVGHGPGMRTLPLGYDAELDADAGVLRLAPPDRA